MTITQRILGSVFIGFIFAVVAAAQQTPATPQDTAKTPLMSEILESSSVSAGTYKNEALGLSITVPARWTISKQFAARGLDKAERERIEQIFMEGLPGGHHLLFSATLMDGRITLIVMPIGEKGAESDIADFKKSAHDPEANILTKDLYKADVGGVSFSAFETAYIHRNTIKTGYYFREHRGMLLFFKLTYSAEKARIELERALNTLKLETK